MRYFGDVWQGSCESRKGCESPKERHILFTRYSLQYKGVVGKSYFVVIMSSNLIISGGCKKALGMRSFYWHVTLYLPGL